jgi:hypothetical protein
VLGTQASSAADFHTAWLISVTGGLAAGAALAGLGPRALNVLKAPAPAEGTA